VGDFVGHAGQVDRCDWQLIDKRGVGCPVGLWVPKTLSPRATWAYAIGATIAFHRRTRTYALSHVDTPCA
jgi:hypothetical protein